MSCSRGVEVEVLEHLAAPAGFECRDETLEGNRDASLRFDERRALGPERAALQRARLHLRGGSRRLRQGRISGGIAALYDALTSAMEWFCAGSERITSIPGARGRFTDYKARYAALVRASVLDGTFDFERLDKVLDRALAMELPAAAAEGILEGVESVLTQLGVLPFDEGTVAARGSRHLLTGRCGHARKGEMLLRVQTPWSRLHRQHGRRPRTSFRRSRTAT